MKTVTLTEAQFEETRWALKKRIEELQQRIKDMERDPAIAGPSTLALNLQWLENATGAMLVFEAAR